MKQTVKKQIILWGLIALVFVGLRIVMRHLLNVPYDFMPLAAIALFSTVLMGRSYKAPLIALAAVFISDFGLSFFSHESSPFYSGFYWQYIAYGLIVAMSFRFSTRMSTLNTGLFGLSAAIVFFLVSNFGAWATGTLYPMTFHGLLTSYYMGIPFFRASLLGDLFYAYAFYAASVFVRTKLPHGVKTAA